LPVNVAAMPSDNVSPFRPRPKRPAPPPRKDGLGFNTHRGKAVLVQLLTLATFAVNWFFPTPPWSLIGLALGIGGFMLAYSNRGQAMPWANTHHEHALRTLLIGYSIWVLAGLLTYVSPFLWMATLFVRIVVALWAGIRSAIGAVLAFMRKPISNPRGILF
jgi:uncharacterized membrane protein